MCDLVHMIQYSSCKLGTNLFKILFYKQSQGLVLLMVLYCIMLYLVYLWIFLLWSKREWATPCLSSNIIIKEEDRPAKRNESTAWLLTHLMLSAVLMASLLQDIDLGVRAVSHTPPFWSELEKGGRKLGMEVWITRCGRSPFVEHI